MRKIRRFVYCVLFVATLAPASELPSEAARTCEFHVGERVVLAADPADPDVFVWDSRARLLAYVAGEWKNTTDILAHTVLIEPGAKALVVFCNAGAGRPRYDGIDEDMLEVRLLTGDRRGLLGWVRSSETHAVRGGVRRQPKPRR